MKFEVIREVTTRECWWLNKDIPAGTIVYRYDGNTYGCCTESGVACCLEEGQTPFFELPMNALEKVRE